MDSASLTAFFIVILIWLGVISFVLLRFYLTYGKLSKNGDHDSLLALLKDISSVEEHNKKTLDQLAAAYGKLDKEGLSHIQKIGLVRFNPFKDTGGDQSFVLALVDGQDTGVVISSLHTRTGTRWYAKGVVRGKGVEYELSSDEEKALKGAKHLAEQSE